jgi:hypothetical protein
LIAAGVIIGMLLMGVISIAPFGVYAENRAMARRQTRTGMVTAALSGLDGRTRRQDVIELDFTNRGSSPAVVGLTARTEFWPGWRRRPQTTKVPALPRRRRYRACAQQMIDVIPGNATVRLNVRVPSAYSRCRVIAVVGESDGYLRVISVRIPANQAAWMEQFPSSALFDITPWLL